MKTLSFTIQKLWPMIMFLQIDKQKEQNYMPLSVNAGGIIKKKNYSKVMVIYLYSAYKPFNILIYIKYQLHRTKNMKQ